jgi:hypothetical protein
VLAKQGNLAEALNKLESALSERRKVPGLSPWLTLIGLLALAQVCSAQGDRAGGRVILAEARATLEPFAGDADSFPELFEQQERKLRARKPPNGQPRPPREEGARARPGLAGGADHLHRGCRATHLRAWMMLASPTAQGCPRDFTSI